VGREAICRDVAGGGEVVEGREAAGGVEASWIEESTSMSEEPEGAGGFHLHGRVVGRGVNLHGGCSWGLNREGSWGTGVKSGGSNRFRNGSKGSSGAVFKRGRPGFHHEGDLWRLRQPEVAPPGSLCRKKLQAERER